MMEHRVSKLQGLEAFSLEGQRRASSATVKERVRKLLKR